MFLLILRIMFVFQYIFRQKCHAGINNYNIVQYNSSVIDYCTAEDVPNEISFTVIWDEDDGCK